MTWVLKYLQTTKSLLQISYRYPPSKGKYKSKYPSIHKLPLQCKLFIIFHRYVEKLSPVDQKWITIITLLHYNNHNRANSVGHTCIHMHTYTTHTHTHICQSRMLMGIALEWGPFRFCLLLIFSYQLRIKWAWWTLSNNMTMISHWPFKTPSTNSFQHCLILGINLHFSGP